MQQQQANGCSVALTAYRKSSANLKAVWPGIFGSVFGRFSAKLGPKAPLHRRGLVLQCRLHQKSARQTNSKAMSLRQKKATRWPSSTQATTTHKPTDCPLNKPSGTLLKGPNRLLPGLRPQGPTNESQRPAETEQKSFGWQAKVTGRFCPSERTSQPRHPSGRHTARATSCA